MTSVTDISNVALSEAAGSSDPVCKAVFLQKLWKILYYSVFHFLCIYLWASDEGTDENTFTYNLEHWETP